MYLHGHLIEIEVINGMEIKVLFAGSKKKD